MHLEPTGRMLSGGQCASQAQRLTPYARKSTQQAKMGNETTFVTPHRFQNLLDKMWMHLTHHIINHTWCIEKRNTIQHLLNKTLQKHTIVYIYIWVEHKQVKCKTVESSCIISSNNQLADKYPIVNKYGWMMDCLKWWTYEASPLGLFRI